MDFLTYLLIAIVGGVVYYFVSMHFATEAGLKKLKSQRSLMQTVEVGKATDNSTAPRRNYRYPDLMTRFDQKITTLLDIFESSVSNGTDNPFLAHREVVNGVAGEYKWQTYGQVRDRRDRMGSALKKVFKQKFGEPVGIYSLNRPEWILTDLACQKYGFPSISLYDTLGANAVEYIISHAEVKTAICAGKQLDIMLQVAKSTKVLRNIVCMDAITDKQREAATAAGVNLYELSKFEQEGAEYTAPDRLVKPEDIYTIMYTSGTTGNPKGVVMTNAAYVAEISGVRSHQESLFGSEDTHMSYLPLAHSFERIVIMTMMSYGARVGFFQGILTELFNDIAVLRPTFLVGAPRVWQRLQERVLAAIDSSPPLRRNLFYFAYNQKKQALAAGRETPVWDKILFSKTKARLGGRVKWLLSGSAPLDPSLGEFLKICFCCPVLEGYGLTENAAGATATRMDETQLGHVGLPFPCMEFKLVDVPEMNYSSKSNPPKGEIWLRGANLFREYYKEPEKTREVLFADGWFATGDIGRINPNGTLSIIDRKKNIFKLAQGEYVAVEYLEGVFKRSQFVGQVWVYGDSFQRYLVSVVVPNYDYLNLWAKKEGITDLSEAALCANPKVKSAIHEDMIKVGKAAQLQPFEFIKSLTLFDKPFSVDNDLTTPTFKLKRPQLKDFFKDQIKKMYDEINAREKS